MKLIAVLLTAFCLQSSAIGFGQNTITLSVKHTELKKVLSLIQKQSSYRFLYHDDAELVNTRIDLDVRKLSIEQVMAKILANTSLQYKFINANLVVVSKTTETAKFTLIRGKVVNEKGEPLDGVSIKVKGTLIGTSTSSAGTFSLEVPENATIVVSYVGYESREITLSGNADLNITLKASTTRMDDVVVIGYGTRKKLTLTGSVATINNAELTTTRNENIQNMMTGKIAGLRMVQNSSEPGSYNNTFDIRGMGNPVTVVVDGVPRGNYERLNPNDIESISVLKDASAAVYGFKAANGVVLITTRKGKKGGVELNYNYNQAWQVLSGLPKSVSAVDFMALWNEKALHNVNGGSIVYKPGDFAPYLNGTKQSTDWYAPIIKKVIPESQHNLSASGGSENVTYYVGLGYNRQDGMFKSGDLNYTRYNVLSNVSAKISKALVFDLNLNGVTEEKRQPYQDASWIIRSFWRQLPTQTLYANNNPDYLLNTQVDGSNPVAMSNSAISGYKSFKKNFFRSSVALTWQVPYIKGLKAKGMFAFDYAMSDNKTYQQQYLQYTFNAADSTFKSYPVQSPNQVRRTLYASPSNLAQLSLNYERQFEGGHNVGALILGEQSMRSQDDFYSQRDIAFPLDQLLAGNSLNQLAGVDANAVYKDASKGLVGRFNYDYKSKYFAEFTFRYDGSSKFPTSHQWGFFPAGFAGWRISEENFWKQSNALSFINNLKIRGSYGAVGDEQASSYQFITGYNYPATGPGIAANRLPPGSVFDGVFVNSLSSKGIPNPNITWSLARTSDIGIDVDAWKNRLGVTVDVFQRNRSRLVGNRFQALPSVVGANLPDENLNSDQTRGIDLEITYRNNFKDFNYFVKATYTYARTKFRHRETAKAGNSWENWYNNLNGRYNDVWFAYGGQGQFQNFNDIYNSPVYYNRGTLPGDYIYEDWNGDGQINSLDMHPMYHNGSYPVANGSTGAPTYPLPIISYGITMGGSYKGFDLNLVFNGTAMVSVSYIEQLREPLWGGSALSQFLDRWHPLDPTADPYNPNTKWIPGYFAYTGTLPDVNSSFNIQSGAYLRLKSAELGYTLPVSLISKAGIKGARVSIGGYNILTFTKLRYVDPEHPSSGYGYLYPLNKIYNATLSVTF